MPSLDRMIATAHPNSTLRRKFPNGCTARELPNWGAASTEKDARLNGGYSYEAGRPGPRVYAPRSV